MGMEKNRRGSDDYRSLLPSSTPATGGDAHRGEKRTGMGTGKEKKEVAKAKRYEKQHGNRNGDAMEKIRKRCPTLLGLQRINHKINAQSLPSSYFAHFQQSLRCDSIAVHTQRAPEPDFPHKPSRNHLSRHT